MQVIVCNSNVKSTRDNGKNGVRKKYKMSILSTSFITVSNKCRLFAIIGKENLAV